ncbi:MAG: hypothetical protein KDD70_01135 [Bdellovibrionales bacterium]|nr:hypothetical protein [Bdellovibrionales bacterium]
MAGLRLALSLLRIPRLFVSLLLFPLFLSVILVIIQLWVTSFAMRTVTYTPKNLSEQFEERQKNNLVRKLVYGKGERVEHLEICRWQNIVDENGQHFEVPPQNGKCAPDRLDIAIHVKNPTSFDTSEYERIFEGNFERMHVCVRDCIPDAILSPEAEHPRADAYSFPALMLMNQVYFDEPEQKQYIKLFENKYNVLQSVGTQFFHANGYVAPVQLTNVTYELGLLASIASIVIIALWLAIKAHRRVLDYFARSGALLPMVAAMGKRDFYSAIWIVTILRVGAFLLASVPATYALFAGLGEAEDWGGIFERDIGHLLLWIVCLVVSFSFAAIVASIADLKHRYQLFAVCYRYLPLGLAVLGGAVWTLSFVLGDEGGLIRDILTCLPILGMGPIILVPLFQPHLNVLVINTLLTLVLTIWLIRSNARWFAAHLEDL